MVWILGVIAAVGFAAYALSTRDKPVDWGLFTRTFAEVNPWIFIAALLLIQLTYAGRAVRWQVMLKPIQPHSSFRRILVATIIGFTAVVLFGRAGELVRPYLIATKEKVSFTSQLAAWFLERIYDLLSVLFLFGFALAQIQGTSSRLGPSMTWILQTGGHAVGVLGTVCLAFLILFGLFPQTVEQRLHGAVTILPDKLAYKISGFIKSFVSGTSSTRSALFVLQLVAYTFAEWLLIVGGFLLVFKAIPATQNFTLLDSLVVVGFVAFGSAVQIPGVGGGMQVATVLVLTELFSLPLETAAGVAILLWVAAFVTVVPFGLALAVHEGLQLRKLLQADEMKSL
ncbi:MAG: flippase-like domain-containing protein [Acidobacteria bacterium]|nr:flippase-like domain-containing protein [Acidobacteriota bacterium]